MQRRRAQWATITAMGWGRALVSRAQLAELAFSAVPGLLLGIVIAAAIASQLPGLVLPVLLASSTAGLIALAVVLFSGRRVS